MGFGTFPTNLEFIFTLQLSNCVLAAFEVDVSQHKYVKSQIPSECLSRRLEIPPNHCFEMSVPASQKLVKWFYCTGRLDLAEIIEFRTPWVVPSLFPPCSSASTTSSYGRYPLFLSHCLQFLFLFTTILKHKTV